MVVIPLPSDAGYWATVRHVQPSSHCSRTRSTPDRASSPDQVIFTRPSAVTRRAARTTSGGVRSVRTRPMRVVTSVWANGPPLRSRRRTTCTPSARPSSGISMASRPGATACWATGIHSPRMLPSPAVLISTSKSPRPIIWSRLSLSVTSSGSTEVQREGMGCRSMRGGRVSTTMCSGASCSTTLPAWSRAVTRHACSPSARPPPTDRDMRCPEAAAPALATVTHAPAGVPNWKAFTCAVTFDRPLVASVAEKAMVPRVDSGVYATSGSAISGSVRSTRMVASDAAPGVPSPSTSTRTWWAPSPMPARGTSTPCCPWPGAPAQRVSPATFTRWPVMPSLPKLSAACHAMPADCCDWLIQPAGALTTCADGGATSRMTAPVPPIHHTRACCWRRSPCTSCSCTSHVPPGIPSP